MWRHWSSIPISQLQNYPYELRCHLFLTISLTQVLTLPIRSLFISSTCLLGLVFCLCRDFLIWVHCISHAHLICSLVFTNIAIFRWGPTGVHQISWFDEWGFPYVSRIFPCTPDLIWVWTVFGVGYCLFPPLFGIREFLKSDNGCFRWRAFGFEGREWSET